MIILKLFNSSFQFTRHLSYKKIKKLFPTEKGRDVYPVIKRENNHSNSVALAGFSEKEVESISLLLQRVRKNVEIDWEFVRKGNKRESTNFI